MGAFKPIWTPVDSGEPIIEAFGGLDLDYINERYRIYDPALGRLVEKPWADIVNNRSLPAGRTYWDADGVLQTAAADAPVIEYDPVTGVKLGNRIWGEYRNIVPQSEDFSDTSWIKGDASIATVPGTGLSGQATVQKLVENPSSNRHRLAINIITVGTQSTFRLIVKPDGRELIQITFSGNITNNHININLSTKTVTAASATIQAVVRTLPVGVLEVLITTVNSSGASGEFSVDMITNPLAGRGLGAYTGNGSSGLLLYLAQGSPNSIAPPYAKTTGAPVIIPAETQIIDGQNFLDLWNGAEGSIYAHAKTDAPDPVAAYIFEIGSTDGNNRRFFLFDDPATALLGSVSGGQVLITSMTGQPVGVPSKLTYSFVRSGNAKASRDGVLSPQFSGASPSIESRMVIGGRTSNPTQYLNGHIRRLIILRKALPASLLQRITSL